MKPLRPSVCGSNFGWRLLAACIAVMSLSACSSIDSGDQDWSVTWTVEHLDAIGGHATEVLGAVRLDQGEHGTVAVFDGIDDALVVNALPLAGATEFTLEIVFRPDAEGQEAQRFLHLQENGSESRVLIETRLFPEGTWALDTYINTPAGSHALYDPTVRHALGEWYNATLVYDGTEMRHYVNRRQELAAPLAFQPLGSGKVSIGVRMNRVFWFKGAVQQVRFTPRVLRPEEFLSADGRGSAVSP